MDKIFLVLLSEGRGSIFFLYFKDFETISKNPKMYVHVVFAGLVVTLWGLQMKGAPSSAVSWISTVIEDFFFNYYHVKSVGFWHEFASKQKTFILKSIN